MKKALSKKNLWDKTSLLLKSTLGAVLGLFPTKWLLGKSFRENCKFVHDAQWWSAEQAREYQLNKLREILKLAYERTKFYRLMFDSVGFHPRDLKSLDDMNHLFFRNLRQGQPFPTGHNRKKGDSQTLLQPSAAARGTRFRTQR